MNILLKNKIRKEFRMSKVDYWDEISQSLPFKAPIAEKETFNWRNAFPKRIAAFALCGALAMFAFFTFSANIKPIEITKAETIKLSDLAKIKDDNLKVETETKEKEMQIAIKYLSENK